MNDIEQVLTFYNSKKYSNLCQKAYDMLLEMIISMILMPGSFYSETELSDMIGIGRTPVREAIKRLENCMLLEIVPRSGVKVAEIRMEDYYLQLEVRRLLEKLIIARAAKFAIPSERKELERLADEYRRVTENNDDIGALRVDKEFHLLVSDCARNPFAKKALEPFQILEQRLYFIQYNIEPHLIQEINSAHCSLMELIARGKGDEACEVFDRMLGYTAELVQLRLQIR